MVLPETVFCLKLCSVVPETTKLKFFLVYYFLCIITWTGLALSQDHGGGLDDHNEFSSQPRNVFFSSTLFPCLMS